jgi:heat shock protein HtpX
MTPPIAIGQPVLVYTRIAQNRRKTVLLVALSVLALVPFIVGISCGVSLVITRQVSPSTKPAQASIEREEAYYQEVRSQIPEEDRQEFDARVQIRLAKERAAVARQEAAEDPSLMPKLMLVFGAALTAALALLFWGIARSPTAKLLSAAGAWAAGSGEAEAARLLENLAIGAGLPTPKLYVIETDAPNAFAAGMSPDHAVVAVTRGALKLLDARELEGVLAHEISHIGNHDTRLNTIAASVTLFLRIPYIMFRRSLTATWKADFGNESRSLGFSFMGRSLRLLDIAMAPLALYILVVAPVLGTLVRAAISRGREFLADADAALLTRFPEGLMRALAKIGGAGSGHPNSNPAFSHFYFADPAVAKSWFSDSLLATHPRIEDRIQQLLAFGGVTAVPALEAAVQEGKRYKSERAALEPVDYTPGLAAPDELAALNRGNPMGRVFRVIASEPVPVYDNIRPGIAPMVITRVNPGALIVAFDDPGKMRQVNTANETFGYIEHSVKLVQLENVIPAEIYDPKTLAALEAKLPPLGAVAIRATPQGAASNPNAFTKTQIIIVVAVFVVVLVGVFVLLKLTG